MSFSPRRDYTISQHDVAIICAAVMTLASPTALQAQSVLEITAGVKFCRTLKDDSQRLKCFDGLFAEKPASPPNESVSGPKEWSIEESKSPIDDSPQVTATLALEKVGLILRCKEKRTEVVFATPGVYLGSNQPVKVLTRIGESSAIETGWAPSTTGTAAFAPSPIEFIRALPDNGKLFIRAFGYGGSSAEGLFLLGNVSALRGRIAEACKWPQPSASAPGASAAAPAKHLR